MVKEMVKEDSNTQVEQFMMANGKWIKSRDTVSACIRMVKYMREIGLMIYVMEMELIHILMAENMMEIGKIILDQELVYFILRMEINMTVW